MSCRTRALVFALLAAGAVISCGASDGGQSGTGISAIRGAVVAAPGTSLSLDDIRVSLTGTTIETRTDAGGRFDLQGRASGPGELRFERERDGLFARTDVVVPAGGVLELAEVVIDPESSEAHPTMRRVEFEGFVQGLDCANGAFFVVAKEDESGTIFTVETASATLRDDGLLLTCQDLREGDRVQVDAETPDGETLVNADVVLEDREDEPGDDDDFDDDDAPGRPDDELEDDDGFDDEEDDDQEEEDEPDDEEDDAEGEDDETEEEENGDDGDAEHEDDEEDGDPQHGEDGEEGESGEEEDEHDDAADDDGNREENDDGESDLSQSGDLAGPVAKRSANDPVPRSGGRGDEPSPGLAEPAAARAVDR